jgi:hypothetical protein
MLPLVGPIPWALNFLFQNFSVKQITLPLPSQKIAYTGMFFWEVHFNKEFMAIASVAQLARAADL